jgi:hypothetical protein|tara:strand:+ start:127 stop:417 length:291 start_codon:yes stop_codon:yes gene_type:complete
MKVRAAGLRYLIMIPKYPSKKTIQPFLSPSCEKSRWDTEREVMLIEILSTPQSMISWYQEVMVKSFFTTRYDTRSDRHEVKKIMMTPISKLAGNPK